MATADAVILAESSPEYSRAEQVKVFDSMKTGVKGLVDAGIKTVPKMFLRPLEEVQSEGGANYGDELQPPVIDLKGFDQSADRRKEIVEELRVAAGEWGIFQVVNHGIPTSVLQQTIQGVRRFHELDAEDKKEWYSRDLTKGVRFMSNLDLLFSKNADWLDTLNVDMPRLESQQLPSICRDSIMEHISECKKLSTTMYELLSEALGLPSGHLQSMDCNNPGVLFCHYYPPCPQPEVTLGGKEHTDPLFLTLVLQDQTGGLQAFQEGKWVDVAPVDGAIVINVGDLLQILSNDKFKSPIHRVKASPVGRISMVAFFGADPTSERSYGPIPELTSEEDPPKYKQVVMKDYVAGLMYGTYSDVFVRNIRSLDALKADK